MPRPYPPEFKDQVLQRFIANKGDIMRTCRELGISDRTLYRWTKKAGLVIKATTPTATTIAPTSPTSVGTEQAQSAATPDAIAIPLDDLQALRDLKSQMLREAEYISVNIRSAVEAAPLSQRVAALAQLIDRIIKLAAQLPAYDENELLEELLDEGEAEDEEEEEDFSDAPYRPESDY